MVPIYWSFFLKIINNVCCMIIPAWKMNNLKKSLKVHDIHTLDMCVWASSYKCTHLQIWFTGENFKITLFAKLWWFVSQCGTGDCSKQIWAYERFPFYPPGWSILGQNRFLMIKKDAWICLCFVVSPFDFFVLHDIKTAVGTILLSAGLTRRAKQG